MNQAALRSIKDIKQLIDLDHLDEASFACNTQLQAQPDNITLMQLGPAIEHLPTLTCTRVCCEELQWVLRDETSCLQLIAPYNRDSSLNFLVEPLKVLLKRVRSSAVRT